MKRWPLPPGPCSRARGRPADRDSPRDRRRPRPRARAASGCRGSSSPRGSRARWHRDRPRRGGPRGSSRRRRGCCSRSRDPLCRPSRGSGGSRTRAPAGRRLDEAVQPHGTRPGRPRVGAHAVTEAMQRAGERTRAGDAGENRGPPGQRRLDLRTRGVETGRRPGRWHGRRRHVGGAQYFLERGGLRRRRPAHRRQVCPGREAIGIRRSRRTIRRRRARRESCGPWPTASASGCRRSRRRCCPSRRAVKPEAMPRLISEARGGRRLVEPPPVGVVDDEDAVVHGVGLGGEVHVVEARRRLVAENQQHVANGEVDRRGRSRLERERQVAERRALENGQGGRPPDRAAGHAGLLEDQQRTLDLPAAAAVEIEIGEATRVGQRRSTTLCAGVATASARTDARARSTSRRRTDRITRAC